MENKTQEFTTKLATVNNNYFPMIASQLENNKIEFTEYAKRCTLNAIASINKALDAQSISWNDENLDKSDITQTLLTVASLQLNSAATPREVYFQIRTVGVKSPDGKGTTWKKRVEMGIEGDGWDSLLARYGRNVAKVYPYWLVRENDGFTYPTFNGLETTPPTWQPKGDGKVIRIVYPILHTDNTIHYYIAERKDVLKNLIAHINNNMMNETFGFVVGQKKDSKGNMVDRTRYDATDEEKANIAQKKKELLSKAKELDLDALLDSPEFEMYISPAWKESSESMVIRKMRNNIVKKIPKDFSSTFVEEMYNQSSDENYKASKAEMLEAESQTLQDVDFEEVEGETVDKETGEVIDKPEF